MAASALDASDSPPPRGENLRELWARRGRHTVEAGGYVWARHHGPFYMPLAPEVRLEVSGAELDAMLLQARMAALRAPLVPAAPTESGAYVVDLATYSLSTLRRSARRNVHRGLEGCSVRQLTPAELRASGFPLTLDTLQRQRRRDEEFGTERGWARFIDAITGEAHLRIHGAFVGDALASWTISSREGAWLRLLWKFGRTALRSYHPDHALDFVVLTEAAAEPGLRHAVDGHVATLGDPGLDQYKRSHGFRVEPHQKLTRFHPLLAPLMRSPAAHGALRALRRALPDETRLALGQRILEEQEEI